MALQVENGDVVVPGEVLYEGTEYTAGDGVFDEHGALRSRFLGAVSVRRDDSVKVIPKHDPYVPSAGDLVIGEIVRVGPSNWSVDINCPYDGFLHVNEAVDEYVDHDDDISQWYDMGDLVVGKVKAVTKGMDVKMSMDDANARKLEGGRVITVAPAKVPRIIGSGGSMVEMIKDATGAMIIVGQNGRIWVDGGDEDLAVRAVRTVAERAHESGLTETMEDWLADNGGDL